MHRSLNKIAFVTLFCSLTVGIVGVSAERSPQNASTMRNMLQTLASVFPVSLHLEEFRDPENNAIISNALNTMLENAEELESHGRMQNASFDFLRKSLVNDIREAAESFEQEDYTQARMSLHQLTENCFACHTRLPGATDENLGKNFMEAVEVEPLPLDDRGRLEVVTRMYDQALETYETLLEQPFWNEPPIGFDGAFENYLKISLRVQDDFTRPLEVLEAFRQREDMPQYLVNPIKDWIDALETLKARPVSKDTLAYAKALIREAQQRKVFPGDRQGMIHFVVASKVLHRYVLSSSADPQHLAEAYFLLGVAESHISSTAWISETEFFLENAIRLSPDAPFAERAFAALEEYVLLKYGGVLGMPPEVWEQLEEVRMLVHKP